MLSDFAEVEWLDSRTFIGRSDDGSAHKVTILELPPVADDESSARVDALLFAGHKGIINATQLFFDNYNGTECLVVVEPAGDVTLDSILRQAESIGTGLPPTLVRSYVRSILQCVSALHSISHVHGDLHPSRIVVDPMGNAKLRFFELNEGGDDGGSESIRAGSVRGAVERVECAPIEALLGFGSGRFRRGAQDMWAVGLVMLRMLTGTAVDAISADSGDHLVRLFNLLGFPTKSECGYLGAAFEEFPAAAEHRPPPSRSLLGPDAPAATVDLLDSLLAFDPDARPTAADALRAPYFADFRDVLSPAKPGVAARGERASDGGSATLGARLGRGEQRSGGGASSSVGGSSAAGGGGDDTAWATRVYANEDSYYSDGSRSERGGLPQPSTPRLQGVGNGRASVAPTRTGDANSVAPSPAATGRSADGFTRETHSDFVGGSLAPGRRRASRSPHTAKELSIPHYSPLGARHRSPTPRGGVGTGVVAGSGGRSWLSPQQGDGVRPAGGDGVASPPDRHITGSAYNEARAPTNPSSGDHWAWQPPVGSGAPHTPSPQHGRRTTGDLTSGVRESGTPSPSPTTATTPTTPAGAAGSVATTGRESGPSRLAAGTSMHGLQGGPDRVSSSSPVSYTDAISLLNSPSRRVRLPGEQGRLQPLESSTTGDQLPPGSGPQEASPLKSMINRLTSLDHQLNSMQAQSRSQRLNLAAQAHSSPARVRFAANGQRVEPSPAPTVSTIQAAADGSELAFYLAASESSLFGDETLSTRADDRAEVVGGAKGGKGSMRGGWGEYERAVSEHIAGDYHHRASGGAASRVEGNESSAPRLWGASGGDGRSSERLPPVPSFDVPAAATSNFDGRGRGAGVSGGRGGPSVADQFESAYERPGSTSRGFSNARDSIRVINSTRGGGTHVGGPRDRLELWRQAGSDGSRVRGGDDGSDDRLYVRPHSPVSSELATVGDDDRSAVGGAQSARGSEAAVLHSASSRSRSEHDGRRGSEYSGYASEARGEPAPAEWSTLFEPQRRNRRSWREPPSYSRRRSSVSTVGGGGTPDQRHGGGGTPDQRHGGGETPDRTLESVRGANIVAGSDSPIVNPNYEPVPRAAYPGAPVGDGAPPVTARVTKSDGRTATAIDAERRSGSRPNSEGGRRGEGATEGQDPRVQWAHIPTMGRARTHSVSTHATHGLADDVSQLGDSELGPQLHQRGPASSFGSTDVGSPDCSEPRDGLGHNDGYEFDGSSAAASGGVSGARPPAGAETWATYVSDLAGPSLSEEAVAATELSSTRQLTQSELAVRPSREREPVSHEAMAATSTGRSSSGVSVTRLSRGTDTGLERGGAVANALIVTVERLAHLELDAIDGLDSSNTNEEGELYIAAGIGQDCVDRSDAVVFGQPFPAGSEGARSLVVDQQFVFESTSRSLSDLLSDPVAVLQFVLAAPGQSSSRRRDRVVAATVVDLLPLAKGMAVVDGWYHIEDVTGTCSIGQVKLRIEPDMSLRESSGGSGRPPFNVTLSPNVASLSGLGYSRVVRGSSDHYSREEDASSLPSLASLATPSGYGPQHRYTDTSYASVATSLRVVSPPPSFGGSRAFSLERDSSPNDPLARARQLLAAVERDSTPEPMQRSVVPPPRSPLATPTRTTHSQAAELSSLAYGVSSPATSIFSDYVRDLGTGQPESEPKAARQPLQRQKVYSDGVSSGSADVEDDATTADESGYTVLARYTPPRLPVFATAQADDTEVDILRRLRQELRALGST